MKTLRKKHSTFEADQQTPDLMQEPPLEAKTAQLPDENADAASDELLIAQKLRDEYLNLAQRVQADFDNYRRRNNAARAESFDEGAIAFIKTLLPVIDNMERAVVSAKDTSDVGLRDGVNMILNQLTECLSKRGVTSISRQGEVFDPNLENAILQGTPEEGEPGTVCEVFQKGYMMDKTVIRHAMVKVVAD